jgi:hypothetical protein
MEQWFVDHWPKLILAAMIAVKVLNMVTRHFADYRGVVRWCVFLIDLLDVVKSSHGGLPGSRPPGPPPIPKDTSR